MPGKTEGYDKAVQKGNSLSEQTVCRALLVSQDICGKVKENTMNNIIPCSILRGGTSKGLYLLDKDLPPAGPQRDEVLLRLMGTPDARQIDGLGGATSTTSKVAILSAADGIEADVLYTFAQVAVEQSLVSYAGNCGNISAGVGPFAIESGLVKASHPLTTVRIINTNTGKLLVEEVETPDGQVHYDGSFRVAGVPGTAAPIKMKFMNPAGSMGRGLLPTGNVVDTLTVPGIGAIEVSVVDATNPLVFARAADVGLSGRELPAEIDADPALLALFEGIRGEAAKLLGLVENAGDAALQTPGIPKLTLVAKAQDYSTPGGEGIAAGDIDLTARMMSMQKAHPTYAMTGAMCTAAAAVVPGSLVAQVLPAGFDPAALRIGQPGGILTAGVDYTAQPGIPQIRSAFGFRTARLLMKGTAYL